MGAGMSISSGQSLALTDVLATSGSSFATPADQITSLTTANPLSSLVLNQSITQLDSIGQAVTRSMYDLTEFQGLSAGSSAGSAPPSGPATPLLASYSKLLMQVQQYKAVASTLDPAALNTQLAKFRTTLSDLDSQKAKLISGGSGFVPTFKEAMHFYVINTLYFIGPLFAAVIVTNTFYYNPSGKVPNSTFWIYKAFYAFWAALWYPAVLFYGAIDPPIFRAILPFIESNDPTSNPIPVFGFRVSKGVDDPVQSEKGRLILRLISIGLFAIFLYAFVFYGGITPPGVAA